MTSLLENLKMKGGGDRKPGCPNNFHFKLHKISKGRSQKHSIFGLNLLALHHVIVSLIYGVNIQNLLRLMGMGFHMLTKLL